MQTVVHAYCFDLTKPEEKTAYTELCAKLKDWPHQMKSHTSNGLNNGGYYSTGRALDGKTIELEAGFLFENQWNTAPIPGFSEKGYRVFDWAEDAYFHYTGSENLNRRTGYWLEQTEEMKAARRNRLTCGYCGKFEPADCGKVFCDKCIDSPYLKVADLHLTRLRPVDTSFKENRAPLTDEERATLIPIYRDAQNKGTTERGKKALAEFEQKIEEKFRKDTEGARIERDGFRWLIAHGFAQLAMNNVIYYRHTGQFGFGWRRKLDEDETSALLDQISEFPFPYKIETEKRGELESAPAGA